MKNNKKDTNTFKYSKAIVILCIVSVWTFVIMCINASIMGATISDVLIGCFFTFFGVEILSLAGIKIMDTIKEKTKDIKYDGSTLQDNIDRFDNEYERRC